MKVETLKLIEVKPYWKNPRENERAVARLVDSISEFGYTNPIVVDEQNVILCGHARYQALSRLEYKDIEVVRVSGLSEEQSRRFRIADNKSGELSEWDYDLLRSEISDLGFDTVKPFFEGWEDLLGIKELTEASTKVEEGFEYVDSHEEGCVELLCPHCLADIEISKVDLLTMIQAAMPEQEAS